MFHRSVRRGRRVVVQHETEETDYLSTASGSQAPPVAPSHDAQREWLAGSGEASANVWRAHGDCFGAESGASARA